MTDTLRITSNDLVALTQTEVDKLKEILDTGDRGGFYMTYYAMTGSDEAELQSRIATFSGPVGHAAFAANRLLQEAFGPGTGQTPVYAGIYNISQKIALEGLKIISDDAESGATGGRVTEADYYQTTITVWDEQVHHLQYFPGNIFNVSDVAAAFTSFLTVLANDQSYDKDLILNLIRQNANPGALTSALAVWVYPNYGKTAADMSVYAKVDGPNGFDIYLDEQGRATATLGLDGNDVAVVAGASLINAIFLASGIGATIANSVFQSLINDIILQPADGVVDPSKYSEFSTGGFNGDTQSNSFSYTQSTTAAHWSQTGSSEKDIVYAANGYADGGGDDDLVFGRDSTMGFGGVDELKGGDGNDIIWGKGGNDTLEGNKGDDILRGGRGDDTFRGGDGSDILDGGDITTTRADDGIDTADYALNDDGGRADRKIEIKIGEGEQYDEGVISIVDGSGATDLLFSIERIVGTDNNDKVIVKALLKSQLEDPEYIDGGGQESDGDFIDASAVSGAVRIDLRDTNNQTVQSAGGKGPVLHLKNFESGKGTDRAGSSHRPPLPETGHARSTGRGCQCVPC